MNDNKNMFTYHRCFMITGLSMFIMRLVNVPECIINMKLTVNSQIGKTDNCCNGVDGSTFICPMILLCEVFYLHISVCDFDSISASVKFATNLEATVSNKYNVTIENHKIRI